MLIIAKLSDIEQVATSIKGKFKLTVMGRIRYLLGIKIKLEPGKEITFNQKKYMQNLLKQFKMDKANAVRLPIDPCSGGI